MVSWIPAAARRAATCWPVRPMPSLLVRCSGLWKTSKGILERTRPILSRRFGLAWIRQCRMFWIRPPLRYWPGTGRKSAPSTSQTGTFERYPLIYQDNSFSIGRTPLVKLNRVIDGAKAIVLAKIEGRNPSFSVKCRIGASMIWDAENRGILKPGMEIAEATSGNTGIALAFVAAARGFRVTLMMPDTMSLERRKVLKVLGANLILTEGAKGMKGALAADDEMRNSDPGHYHV